MSVSPFENYVRLVASSWCTGWKIRQKINTYSLFGLNRACVESIAAKPNICKMETGFFTSCGECLWMRAEKGTFVALLTYQLLNQLRFVKNLSKPSRAAWVKFRLMLFPQFVTESVNSAQKSQSISHKSHSQFNLQSKWKISLTNITQCRNFQRFPSLKSILKDAVDPFVQVCSWERKFHGFPFF